MYEVWRIDCRPPRRQPEHGQFEEPVLPAGLDPKQYAMRPVIDPNWRERERNRFRDGTYKEPPWDDYVLDILCNRYPEHFVHMSTKRPGHVAYTESPEKGEQDRQTPILPGRYLQQFMSEYLDARAIERLAAMCSAGELELKFATTADEIEDVYVRTRWTGSCMSGRASDYESSVHPSRVYAAGDLAVAYIEDKSITDEDLNIRGRCLVWPEKKVWGRMYGDHAKLAAKLTEAGYSEGELRGARLLKINDDGDYYVMPYIDWYHSVSDAGEYFKIDGNISAENTHGLIELEERAYCSHCDNRVHLDDIYDYAEGVGDICISCYEDSYFTCNETGDIFHADHMVKMWDGRLVSDYWFDRNGYVCDRTGENRDDERVTLHDTGETVSLEWAEKNAHWKWDRRFNAGGRWLSEQPEPDTDELEEAA